MAEPDFNSLADRLTSSGITARHAARAVAELEDHFDDLVQAEIDAGVDAGLVRANASANLGSTEDFVAAMSARRELKSWAFRYPRLAMVLYPIACLAVLPAVPVVAGLAHRDAVMRWSASLCAAGVVTAGLMLVMQLSIILG